MKEEVVVFVSYVEEKEEGKNKLLGGNGVGWGEVSVEDSSSYREVKFTSK